MTTLQRLIDDHRSSLRDAVESTAPPTGLRDRVLRAHATRRTVKRAAPFMAIMVVFFSLALVNAPTGRSVQDWQSRSVDLEASWRADGDRQWLVADARAQPLLYRLRQVDAQIERLGAVPSSNTDSLARLWRERTETLSALIDSRRQGGLAIQL